MVREKEQRRKKLKDNKRILTEVETRIMIIEMTGTRAATNTAVIGMKVTIEMTVDMKVIKDMTTVGTIVKSIIVNTEILI